MISFSHVPRLHIRHFIAQTYFFRRANLFKTGKQVKISKQSLAEQFIGACKLHFCACYVYGLKTTGSLKPVMLVCIALILRSSITIIKFYVFWTKLAWAWSVWYSPLKIQHNDRKSHLVMNSLGKIQYVLPRSLCLTAFRNISL